MVQTSDVETRREIAKPYLDQYRCLTFESELQMRLTRKAHPHTRRRPCEGRDPYAVSFVFRIAQVRWLLPVTD
jgi:hypothetical protein